MAPINDDVILSVNAMNTFYGKAQILFDVELTLKRGEVVVILGRNGAGKTTTLKSIMKLTVPKSGQVSYKGKVINKMKPYQIPKLGLGYVPEDRRVFSGLTVSENLEVGRQNAREGFQCWTPERLFELFPNLKEMKDRLGQHMSGGEQQMLSIARTLMGNPEVIILDEPSEGLAPVITDQLAHSIQKLKEEGVSLLLAEQNLGFAKAICDRAYFIDHGHICHESKMEDLSDETIQKYLSIK